MLSASQGDWRRRQDLLVQTSRLAGEILALQCAWGVDETIRMHTRAHTELERESEIHTQTDTCSLSLSLSL